MQGDPIKCPHCRSPLRLDYMSHNERRFRCTVCGKQTTVQVKDFAPIEPSGGGGEDASA